MKSPNAAYGKLARGVRRDMSEKGWVPVRYWVIWFTSLGIAMVVFYVVLTPIWLGLRAAAWIAELRARRGSREPAPPPAPREQRPPGAPPVP